MIVATPAHGQASRVIARRMRSERQVLAIRAGEPPAVTGCVPIAPASKHEPQPVVLVIVAPATLALTTEVQTSVAGAGD